MNLKETFTRPVVTAGPEDTAVATRMQERNVGTVVVVQDQRPVGIITDRDLALALGTRRISADTPARDQARRGRAPGHRYLHRYEVCQGVRRLPIVDKEDRVVGLVSMDDLLRFLARELNNLLKVSTARYS